MNASLFHFIARSAAPDPSSPAAGGGSDGSNLSVTKLRAIYGSKESLIIAAIKSKKRIDKKHIDIKTLIKAGVNVNAKDNYGDTPLIAASYRNYAEVAKALIDAGADVNVKHTNGDTALIAASKQGHIEVVKILIDNPNVDLNIRKNRMKNIRKNRMKTALGWAIKRDRTEIIRLLKEAGATE